MSERSSANLGIVIALLVSISIILLSERAIAQTTTCPAGNVPATAADIPAMQAAGIPNPTVGMCWNPNSQYVGQASAQAKQDLQSMTCSSNVNIQGLDSNFAICADKFMKALRQVNPTACINSAYRSPQQQLVACMGICGASSCPGTCAAPGTSYHQRGLAIDVAHISNNQQAWQIAISSTNGGVANPSGLHSSDPDHFQATASSCAGAPVPQSNQLDYYPSTLTTAQVPQSIVGGTSSSLPAGYCVVSTNPLVAVPCNSTSGTLQTTPIISTTPIPSTATTTPTVTPTSALSVPTSTATAFSNLLQTQPIILPPTATSATQALNIITNLGSSISGNSLSLNQNLTNIINTIIPGDNATDSQSLSPLSQTLTYPQDTFVSGVAQYTPDYTSQFSQILTSLQSVLTNLLSYLRSL